MTRYLAIALCTVLAVAVAAETADAQRAQKTKVQMKMLAAPQEPSQLELIAVGRVAQILNSETIRLEKGGEYILDNIRVPVQFDAHARNYLKQNLLNKVVGLYAPATKDGNYADNYGKTRVHIMTEDARWIQAELVASGFAFAYSTRERPNLVTGLYPYERIARQGMAGLWAHKALMLKNSQTIATGVGAFQVYEGQVTERQKTKEGTFILFNKTLKDDLKVFVESDTAPVVNEGLRPFSLDALPGYYVRIHGWVENNAGPMIKITHPQQIEIHTETPMEPPIPIKSAPAKAPAATPATP